MRICPMDKKRQEVGREERKTCGDEEGACIELESLDSVLGSVIVGWNRLVVIGWY